MENCGSDGGGEDEFTGLLMLDEYDRNDDVDGNAHEDDYCSISI